MEEAKDLSETEIEKIYNNYKYGNRLTFYIYFIPQALNQSNEQLFANLAGYEFPLVIEENINYESLPNLKSITFLDYSILPDNETIEITLDSPINAVLGSVTQRTITIVDGNLPPQIAVLVEQDGNEGRVIAADKGEVTITATVSDPNLRTHINLIG